MDESGRSKADPNETQQLLRILKTPAKLEHSPWLSSCQVARKLREKPQLAPHQALREVCSEVLQQLRTEVPHYADILYGRYWQEYAVKSMLAAQRPSAQSERQFHKQQAQAIERFALLFRQQEEFCRQAEQSSSLPQQLPLVRTHQLFGISKLLSQVLHHLHDPNDHIVVIKGIGGIGKTTAAHEAVDCFLEQVRGLAGLLWITAKQEYVTGSGIEKSKTQMQVADVFDEIGHKMGLVELPRLPLKDKVARLIPLLRSKAYLIVIDNLETVEDFQQLLPWLERLVRPTKFLLTSREALPSLTTVSQIDVSELNQEDSLSLIRYMAREKQIADLDPLAIFRLVGGNPLAIILTISQMRYSPPSDILSGIQAGTISDIYTYIYHKVWSTLSDDARKVLLAFQRVGDTGDWEWFSEMLEFSPSRLFVAMRQLIDLSLVQPHPHNQGHRLFQIHRLTSTFIRTEILGWKTGRSTN